MNVVLIGYRGTGKSTVGKIVAERLGFKVISADEEIVRRAGKRIPDIVAEKGWDHFRDLESEVIVDLAKMDDIVIDAGGGVIVRWKNVDLLREKGIVFWLTAEIKTIAARIGGDTERPSLTTGKTFVEEIEDVLKVRIPIYRQAAHHAVPTDGRQPTEIAEEILRLLK